MKRIVFATNNPSKLKELRDIFTDLCDGEYELLSLSDVGFDREIAEDADSFEGNALIKARTVRDFCGLAAIADDSGLAVDALSGAPGVYSARYAGVGASSDQMTAKLLENMKGVKEADRGARFISVMCAVLPGGKTFSCRGECEGRILEEKKGSGGFGYDPVFFYAPLGKTFAEMTDGEKNAVSHRAAASRGLVKMLSPLDDADFCPVDA